MVYLTGSADSFRKGVAATLCCLLWLAAPSAWAAGPAGPNNPVVLAQAAPAAAPSALNAAIRETVSAWAKAWSARDVEGYLGFYSPAFKPADGESRSAWEKLRRARVGGPRFIEVTISDITVLRRDDDRAAATFGQKYRSDRYQDSVTKTLEFVRDGARWLIVEERSGSAVAETAAAPAKAEPKPEPKPAPAPEPKPESKPEAKPAPAAAAAPATAPTPAAQRGVSAGLGTLQVLSNLGQPLRAEIDLLSLRANERENVNVRLAPIEMFREAGIEFHHALRDLTLSIELQDGKPIVRLTTRRPVNEPLLELLVELAWGSGRFVREYAILLDPPTYIPPPPADAVMGPTPAAAPAPKPEPPMAAAAPGAAPSAPDAAPTAAGAEYTVVAGDTLAEIASKRRYPDVTLDQMMIALYRTNPEAFIDGDINLLRAGHVLTIPDRDTVAAFDADEANVAVLAAMARSPESRRAIAATAPSARGVQGPRTAPTPAPAPDQVTLARKEKEKAKPAEPPAAAAKADDRAAIERALEEAQARITELERIYADLQKLLVIKDQQIAALEKRIAEMRAAPGAAVLAKPAAEAPKPAPVEKPAAEAPKPPPDEKPAAEAPKPAPVEKPAAEAPKPPPAEKPAAEAPKPAPKPQPKPAAKPRPVPPPPPAPEPGLVERYIGDLGDPVMLVGLIGVALLLVGYGAYAWRKKKREARSQLNESLRSAVEGAAVAAPAAGVAAAAAATDEADPLEEADVYLAYGRDAQAEELLREAVESGDGRPVVYSKLLQIYAKQHDADRFEATARKLKGLVSDEGPEWEKATALGRSIDPGNSLYGQGEVAEVAPAAATAQEPEVDFDLDAVMATGEMPAVTSATATPATVDFAIDTTSTGIERAPEDAGLDFDLGTATTEEPVAGGSPAAEAEAAPEFGAIDFDLGGITTEMPAVTGATAPPEPAPATPPVTEEAPEHIALEFDLGEMATEEPKTAEAAPAAEAPTTAEAAPATSGGVDEGFSFDLGETEAAPPSEEKAAPATAESQLDTISFDLGGAEAATPSAGGGDAKWQEVTTKLQLAKSFEEIGDTEGARELLQEVIADGDAAQRAHAEKMLAGLG